MPTPTYDLIASNVLTSNSASLTFSSIPATYRDLVLVFDLLAVNVSQYSARVTVNNDTGSNYVDVFMRGNGSTTSSSSGTFDRFRVINAGTTTEKGLSIFHFLDYSATDKHKVAFQRTNVTATADPATYAMAHRWANTAAISTITISTALESFAANSSFYLYGIAS
jgi:hypothetical protein